MATLSRILYNNLTAAATVTASAADSGYPDDNIQDWRPYIRWHASGANTYNIVIDMGSATACTCFALSGHTLNTAGARYQLDAHSADAWVGAETNIVAYTTPSDDKTLADFFSSQSFRYWRILIDNNGGAVFDIQLGIAFLGTYLEMPEGVQTPFDPDRQTNKTSRMRGETGQLLGVVTDWTSRNISVTHKFLTPTWTTDTWLPYWEAYGDKPFFYVWDYASHGSQVFLVAYENAEMTIPYDGIYRGPLNLSMMGVRE
ncbi:MAG: hypothetical protein GY847_14245 [Proteobacteria bacterium]|nr:hypothetical protein [Pseudomonadota bacterium]